MIRAGTSKSTIYSGNPRIKNLSYHLKDYKLVTDGKVIGALDAISH
jgi:hypothetical protein